MAGAPFNSLPIYTAATAAPPPPPPDPTAAVKTLQTLTTTTTFRLLCHASRIGGIIGKSGSIIKQLQHDTSSKIRVDDAPPCAEYRVISVTADATVNRTVSFEDDGYGACERVSAAQEALVRVYERVLAVTAEMDGCYFAPGGVVTCRVLTCTGTVGFVIGRFGNVVEKIRVETGCKIRVFGSERLPDCALDDDEMIEIEGSIPAVKKALIAVARRIQDCPPQLSMAFGKPDNRFNREPVSPNGPMDFYPPSKPHNGFNPKMRNGHIDQFPPTRPHNGFNHMDHLPPARTVVQQPALTSSANQHVIGFRILCSGDIVGGVIGSGGTIVRAFENQTGASISVAFPVRDCDERLITITATESPDSQNSPAQNAVILVFSRSVEISCVNLLDPPSSGAPISARLVIPHYQTGCLLGRGGSIMADMRKVTGAFIRIVSGNNFPGCTSPNDEVVVMTGQYVHVRDALYSVTTRLRDNIFTYGHKTSGRGNGQPSYETHSSLATNQHATLTQSMDSLRLFNNVDRHPSSSQPSQSQAGTGKFVNGHGVDRGSTSGKCGVELGRGGRSAIITNTTIEILVPENDIGCVYGENGSNLTRLRQISGAKVVVHEPGSGETDYVVVISGTPDQTQSAQSLLQAFILADQR